MRRASTCIRIFFFIAFFLTMTLRTSAQTTPGGQITLEQLEQMALERNPTLAQAKARIRAAEGLKKQAGLYPNPVVGYTAEEVSAGPVIRGGEHGFFFDQEIVTAGKLGLSRKVFSHEQARVEAEAEAQKMRVLNTVRVYYYQTLGAARLVELRERLGQLTREAVDVSRQLYNVGQADLPDVLEAEVESQRAELALVAARNDQQRVWRQLTAVVGNPALPLSPLAGSLDEQLPELEEQDILARLLSESPEIKIAQAGVARDESALKRARVEPIPDLKVSGGVRYNRERLERGGRPVGWEGVVSVGVRIPLFDRNQGNVAAARADVERAQQGIERVRLSLRSRLAVAFRNYRDSKDTAEKHRKDVLPRAQRAYELYLTKYRQMAAAYPQVLIAQRTHFQLQVEYVEALVDLWRNVTEIRGFLLVDGLDEAAIVGISPRTMLQRGQ